MSESDARIYARAIARASGGERPKPDQPAPNPWVEWAETVNAHLSDHRGRIETIEQQLGAARDEFDKAVGNIARILESMDKQLDKLEHPAPREVKFLRDSAGAIIASVALSEPK